MVPQTLGYRGLREKAAMEEIAEKSNQSNLHTSSPCQPVSKFLVIEEGSLELLKRKYTFQ